MAVDVLVLVTCFLHFCLDCSQSLRGYLVPRVQLQDPLQVPLCLPPPPHICMHHTQVVQRDLVPRVKAQGCLVRLGVEGHSSTAGTLCIMSGLYIKCAQMVMVVLHVNCVLYQ